MPRPTIMTSLPRSPITLSGVLYCWPKASPPCRETPVQTNQTSEIPTIHNPASVSISFNDQHSHRNNLQGLLPSSEIRRIQHRAQPFLAMRVGLLRAGEKGYLGELHARSHVNKARGARRSPLGGADADEAHHEVQVLLSCSCNRLSVCTCRKEIKYPSSVYHPNTVNVKQLRRYG